MAERTRILILCWHCGIGQEGVGDEFDVILEVFVHRFHVYEHFWTPQFFLVDKLYAIVSIKRMRPYGDVPGVESRPG